MSKLNSYYAYYNGKEAWLKDNPGKTERDWSTVGTDIQDQYVNPQMEKYGYKKDRYIGAGAWEWIKT